MIRDPLVRPMLSKLSIACTAAALALLLLAPAQAATSAQPTKAEEQAVLAPLQGIFDGIAKQDRELVRAQLLPGGMATLIRDDKPVQLHFDAFVARLVWKPGDQYEERIHDPIVHIDNDIAVLWTPYVFLINGKLDHCGTDIVNLVRRDGHWLISGVADNSRKNCEGA
jgi:hypothetical protein